MPTADTTPGIRWHEQEFGIHYLSLSMGPMRETQSLATFVRHLMTFYFQST